MIVCIGYCTDCNALCRGLWLGMCMSLTVHLTGLPSDYSNSLSISVGHLLTSMCLGHFLRLAAVQQACALVVLHCIGSPMIDSSQLSGKQAAAGSSRICCTTSAISRHHHSLWWRIRNDAGPYCAWHEPCWRAGPTVCTAAQVIEGAMFISALVCKHMSRS
jgi:hypothetical protein